MGGISVGDEGLTSCQVAAVGEFVIRSALDISKEVFESIPVCWTRIGIKASKIGNRVGNVRACHHGKILEWSNCTEIGNFGHEVLVLL